MRICSFLPSATEILYELGLGDKIYGVSYACDYPPEVKNKPVVVKSAINTANMSSEEIDIIISKYYREKRDLYVLDEKLLKEIRPDVIIAQGICEVCSPHNKEVEKARKILTNSPKVISLDAHDVDEILDSILYLSRELGVEKRGNELVTSMIERISYIQKRCLESKSKPKVLCLEWLKPLYNAGHWVPHMVEICNGINCIGAKKMPSRRIIWEEIREADPDIIICMPCGFDLKRTLSEINTLEYNDEWNKLRAVRNGEVYAVEASSYFSRPSHRVVKGIEILAKILHPYLFQDLDVDKYYKKIY
ncbi:MAG TPA: cobalamin-binding protein [Geobacterales bacterium]|nr:cobalamin-binding protein [Geobacterales bacterium]